MDCMGWIVWDGLSGMACILSSFVSQQIFFSYLFLSLKQTKLKLFLLLWLSLSLPRIIHSFKTKIIPLK